MERRASRQEILAKAREFLGTPGLHQGRLKGRGIDCVGLVLCVAQELNLADRDGDPITIQLYANYPAQPVGRLVHEKCRQHLAEKPPGAELEPGDVLTMRNPSEPCHVAIVSELNGYLAIIHLSTSAGSKQFPNGKVVEHILDAKWRKRIEGVFSFPGVD